MPLLVYLKREEKEKGKGELREEMKEKQRGN